MNSPQPKARMVASIGSASALNPAQPKAYPHAKKSAAVLFNFPHAHSTSGSHRTAGVGDSNSLRPNDYPRAITHAAAAPNLPAPKGCAIANKAPARGSHLVGGFHV